jgi:hypothetical protein
MGELLPDRVPGEPKWFAGARIVVGALIAVGLFFGASSYFVSIMGR